MNEWINKWRGEKAPPYRRKLPLKVESQLINVDGMIELENHHLAIINQARNINGC